ELPNPLETFAGQPIEDAEQWAAVRRPELRELFQHYMYGRQPEAPPEIRGTTLFSDSAAFDGAGTLREVELAFGPPDWPKIYLLIAAPNGPHPAPCFVGINFGGNHMRADDPRVRLPTAWMPDRYPGVVNHRATDAGRGKQGEGWDVWPLAEAVGRGYAVATFYCGDVQPDRPDEVEGMRATVDAAARSAGDATGHLMWWAWGLHRAVDYLAADAAIDPQRIAVVGHSRLGKAALLAGALDERIALTVANQAGCGGSGPSRHDDPEAETVGRISDKYGYWFCPNFAEFGADPARLPFDQHALVALYAPRPVLFTAAADDAWANPSGQFAVLRAATPVYRLLGVAGLDAPALPQPGDPLVASRLGYWIRPGAHAFTPADWQSYMDFADRWLRR
ncbi:MAG TPA: acetylxylan esterase, partial [Lacipirellulaceae bacterium]|nr:acetylxylan esterase [Lacipirellulaceae bacterium]